MTGAVAGVRGGRLYLGGLLCGAALMWQPGSLALAAALLLPGLLAWFAEQRPGRPVARCLLLFGVAGALPALVALWQAGGGLADGVALALDTRRLAAAWAAQAAGWLLATSLPLAGKLATDAALAARAHHLRAERARLAEEWSLD